MKDRPWWIILAFIALTFLGHGAYWNWQQLKLDAAMKAADLRRQENDSYQKIIDLSGRLDSAKKDLSQHSNDRQYATAVMAITGKLEFEKGTFVALERQLARIEQRPEREINLNFVLPSAPEGITVTPLLPEKPN